MVENENFLSEKASLRGGIAVAIPIRDEAFVAEKFRFIRESYS